MTHLIKKTISASEMNYPFECHACFWLKHNCDTRIGKRGEYKGKVVGGLPQPFMSSAIWDRLHGLVYLDIEQVKNTIKAQFGFDFDIVSVHIEQRPNEIIVDGFTIMKRNNNINFSSRYDILFECVTDGKDYFEILIDVKSKDQLSTEAIEIYSRQLNTMAFNMSTVKYAFLYAAWPELVGHSATVYPVTIDRKKALDDIKKAINIIMLPDMPEPNPGCGVCSNMMKRLPHYLKLRKGA